MESSTEKSARLYPQISPFGRNDKDSSFKLALYIETIKE